MSRERLFSTQQAAEMLGISRQTLNNRRFLGRSPAYIKMGRCIHYRERDVVDWIEAHRIDKPAQVGAAE
ncbi:MAG: helix-turn-helix transcriptional regulator [Hyphomicrobiales bacterium]